MKKKTLFFVSGFVLVTILLIFILSVPKVSSYPSVNSFDDEIKIYKSSSCGCCVIYSDYFKSKGNSKIEIINLENLETLKNSYGVPKQLESCHTTIVGDYFVEGHIPLEAVEKLLQEKPDIAGIAMSGMPSGSPGMPGVKNGYFVIYAVNYDGSYEEFMRV